MKNSAEEEGSYWIDMLHCSRHTTHTLVSAYSGAFGCETKEDIE
jgi:hypothetical protein